MSKTAEILRAHSGEKRTFQSTNEDRMNAIGAALQKAMSR
jgi:hypothetical protein